MRADSTWKYHDTSVRRSSLETILVDHTISLLASFPFMFPIWIGFYTCPSYSWHTFVSVDFDWGTNNAVTRHFSKGMACGAIVNFATTAVDVGHFSLSRIFVVHTRITTILSDHYQLWNVLRPFHYYFFDVFCWSIISDLNHSRLHVPCSFLFLPIFNFFTLEYVYHR